MYHIAFDTSNNLLSICLFNKNNIIDYIIDVQSHQQTKNFFNLLKSILKNNNLEIEDISEIVVSVGPGSFTGIRVALAAITGIKLASKIKICGVSNFQVLAHMAKERYDIDRDFCVIIDALREQYYCQKFTSDFSNLDQPFICNYADIIELVDNNIICGLDIDMKGKNIFQLETQIITANDVARSFIFYKTKELLLEATPIYIREAVTKC